MIAEKIKVNPFVFSQLISCRISKEPNEHGQAYVKGYLASQEEEGCLRMLSQETGVQIEGISEEGESRVIFSGRIKKCKLERENQILVLELFLVTHTYLLDLKPRIRSFQVPGMTYQQIFDQVMESYPAGGCMLTREQERTVQELIVQYEETDWAFLKRLASHLQMVIVPEVQTHGIRAYAKLFLISLVHVHRGEGMPISLLPLQAFTDNYDTAGHFNY